MAPAPRELFSWLASKAKGVTARASRAIVAFSAGLTVACAHPTPGTGSTGVTHEQHIVIDGVQRIYRLHLPAHFDSIRRAIPLVFVLHGHGDNAEDFESSTGMSDKADAEGFITVYPQAQGDPSDWHTAIDGSSKRDDVDFIRTLIRTLSHRYHIDQRRIYAAGHSNGGFMTYRLASLLSDKLAAVGVTAGSIGMIDAAGDTVRIAPPPHPVAIIHFHGMKDESVPYFGGPESDGPDNILAVEHTIRFWTRANHCPARPATHVVSNNRNLVVDTYQPCDKATAVMLYTIVDAPHRWPGDDVPWWTFPGPDITDVNATDAMWAFFAAHPKVD